MNYRHPPARYVAALAVTSAALLAAACSGEGGPGPRPSSTEDTTTVARPSPGVPEPPAATAAAAGRSLPLGTGSYCWPGGPGSPAVCVDRFGIVTAADALPVSRGETIVVSGAGLPWTELHDAAVWVQPAAGEPQRLEGGWLAWPPAAPPASLPASSGGDGVAFRVDLEPGRWVAHIFLRFAGGDVSYGLLLEVR